MKVYFPKAICLLLIHMLDHVVPFGEIFQSVNHNVWVLGFDFTDGNYVNLISVGFVQISHQDISYEFGSSFARSAKSSEVNVSSGNVIRDQFEFVCFFVRSLWKVKRIRFVLVQSRAQWIDKIQTYFCHQQWTYCHPWQSSWSTHSWNFWQKFSWSNSNLWMK